MKVKDFLALDWNWEKETCSIQVGDRIVSYLADYPPLYPHCFFLVASNKIFSQRVHGLYPLEIMPKDIIVELSHKELLDHEILAAIDDKIYTLERMHMREDGINVCFDIKEITDPSPY